MFEVEQLRSLLNERLTEADQQILALFERTIEKYEEEICRLKEENRRVEVLEAAFKPEVRLYRADMQEQPPCEEVLPEQQVSLVQEDSNPPTIKEEEEEELGTSQGGPEDLQLGEEDVSELPFTVVCVKSEDDEENSQLLQLHQSQSDESTEAELEYGTVKKEADGDDGGGPQTDGGRPETDSGGPQAGPYCLFPPGGRGSGTSGTDTDDSYEWEPPKEVESSFNNGDVSDLTKKQFSECGEIFESLKPMRIHNPGKSFVCSDCGQDFGQKADLNMHRKVHTVQKPFVCSECGKRFVRKSKLNVHMRIHTGEKPFCCSECGKLFNQKGSLNTHMRIHTGEKPFGCTECGKRFREKGHLDGHIRIHTGGKPFSCSECDKRFGNKCSLKTHMRIHTGEKPFGCPDCGRRFGHKCNLRIHMTIHTGEKPFGCSECGRKFGNKRNLKLHKRIHTGEKPFSCSECGKKFSQSSNLITHARIHAGDNLFNP